MRDAQSPSLRFKHTKADNYQLIFVDWTVNMFVKQETVSKAARMTLEPYILRCFFAQRQLACKAKPASSILTQSIEPIVNQLSQR